MKKTNLDKIFPKSDIATKGKTCNNPEDIVTVEQLNQEMEVIALQARRLFVRSRKMVRGLILDSERVRN